MKNTARSQSYMPEELTAQLRAARESGTMQGERRVITILFCDVSGSTAMAQHLDPEEWAEIMNEAFNFLISPIYRYEGTVARLMGDGLLAFFGAPIAHEDDPQRAVLAGLDIVNGIQQYRSQVQHEYGLDFDVRVGINTGPVVVGAIGSDLAVEYTAMGDAINLAARMEATALPGTVQMTDNTYRLVAPLFDVWDVGPIQVKGKDRPVRAYRALSWRTGLGRIRETEGLNTPLVGRDDELDALRRALSDLRSGRGGIVCLVGEAGLGKSRLIEELRSEAKMNDHLVAEAPFTWLESRSVSFEGAQPYGLFVQFIRENMDIQDNDPPDLVRAKITRGAAALASDQRERMARVVEAVLGVSGSRDHVGASDSRAHPNGPGNLGRDGFNGLPDGSVELSRSGIFALSRGESPANLGRDRAEQRGWGSGVAQMGAVDAEEPETGVAGALQVEGEGFKRELFATLLGATRAVATQRPTVLVCDDIHWADPASIELLGHLFQLVEEVPVLFLCALREYRHAPAWDATATAQTRYPEHCAKIELQPLNQGEGDRLVAGLLVASDRVAVDDLPEQLRRSIWQKTEGNPFFVEEVVRVLIDSGAVVQDAEGVRWNPAAKTEDITIPDNVQSLLIARIDRLDKETQHLLQVAAVIGRSFQLGVLEAVYGTVTDLDQRLEMLQRAQLVHQVSRDPEPRYAFRHALTRDAAYASILYRQRRHLHRRVGRAVETLFRDRLEEEAHRLAYHFDEGRDHERALRYYAMAGDHAARIYANAEAGEQYERAIEIALGRRTGRGVVASSGQIIHLYTRRGRTLEICGQYDDALANYAELEALGRENDEPELELAALLPQATLRATYTAAYNPKHGRALAERALGLARELGDRRAEARALWNLMLVALLSDDNPRQALVYGQQALALARTHNLREELAYTLHDLASVYGGLGRAKEAWAAGSEAGQLWRELGNQPMLVDNLANSAWGRYQLGDVTEAVALAHEALQISIAIGSLWGEAYSLFTLAPLYLEQCDYTRAINAIERGIPLAQQANFEIGQELIAALAGVYGFLGDLERCTHMLHGVVTGNHRREDRLQALTVLAYVSLHHGLPTTAGAAVTAADRQFPTGTSHPFLSISRMMMPVTEAEVAFSEGAYDRVLTVCGDATRALFKPSAPRSNQRTILADLLRIRGQALVALGRLDEAHTALIHARAQAATRDSDRMSWMFLYILWQRRTMWMTLTALSQIESRRGNQAEAEALRAEAKSVVTAVAEHIDDVELRARFVTLPQI